MKRKMGRAWIELSALAVATCGLAPLSVWAQESELGGREWTIDRTVLVGGRGEDVPVAVALGSDGSAVAAFIVEGQRASARGNFEDGFGDGVGGATVRDLRAGKRTNAEGEVLRDEDEAEAPADRDVLVCKYLPGGTRRAWSVLLGGGGDDIARALAVDARGNVVLAGSGNSAALFDGDRTRPAGQRDGWALKLASDGSRVAWSQRIGGEADDFARAVAISQSGEVAILGDSASDTLLGLDNAQAQNMGARGRVDVWLARLGENGEVRRVLALGGRADDFGRALAFDRAGALWAAGETGSGDFPLASAFDRASIKSERPSTQIWLARLAPSTSGGSSSTSDAPEDDSVLPGGEASAGLERMEWARLWGGSREESVRGLSVRNGRATIAGFTSSRDFPLRASQASGARGGWDALAASFDISGRALWSTAWGGSGDDFASAVGSDARGVTFVAGHTASPDFPLANAQAWPLARAVTQAGQGAQADAQAWLCAWGAGASATRNGAQGTEEAPAANRLLFSAAWGGRRDDRALGLALGRNGLAAVGRTSSPDFPLVQRTAPVDPNAVEGDDYAAPRAPRESFRGGVDGWLLWARWPRLTQIAQAPRDAIDTADSDDASGSNSALPSGRDPYDNGRNAIDDLPGDALPGNDLPGVSNGGTAGIGVGGGDTYPSSGYPNYSDFPAAPLPNPLPRGDEPAPRLSLSVERSTISERDGARAFQTQVTRNTRADEDLTLDLASSDPERLRVPPRITIPQGRRTASFRVQAIDNARRDGDASVWIEVRRGNAPYLFPTERVRVRVLDDERDENFNTPDVPAVPITPVAVAPSLTVALLAEEARGDTERVRGVIRREGDLSVAASAELRSSEPALASVPAVITLAAGQRDTFFVIVVSPRRAQGRQSVTISARALGGATGAASLTLIGDSNAAPPSKPNKPPKSPDTSPIEGGANNPVEAPNNPPPAARPADDLRLFVFAPRTAAPGTRVTIVVERQGRGRGALEVQLTSSDTGLLAVPATVTIGASLPRVNITLLAGTSGAAKTVGISARAIATDGSARLASAAVEIQPAAQAPAETKPNKKPVTLPPPAPAPNKKK